VNEIKKTIIKSYDNKRKKLESKSSYSWNRLCTSLKKTDMCVCVCVCVSVRKRHKVVKHIERFYRIKRIKEYACMLKSYNSNSRCKTYLQSRTESIHWKNERAKEKERLIEKREKKVI